MADRNGEQQTVEAEGPVEQPSLSPAEEAGPDLPSREGVPQWVPRGQEERWRNSERIAGELFPGNSEMVWQTARAIFHDRERYPD